MDERLTRRVIDGDYNIKCDFFRLCKPTSLECTPDDIGGYCKFNKVMTFSSRRFGDLDRNKAVGRGCKSLPSRKMVFLKFRIKHFVDWHGHVFRAPIWVYWFFNAIFHIRYRWITHQVKIKTYHRHDIDALLSARGPSNCFKACAYLVVLQTPPCGSP